MSQEANCEGKSYSKRRFETQNFSRWKLPMQRQELVAKLSPTQNSKCLPKIVWGLFGKQSTGSSFGHWEPPTDRNSTAKQRNNCCQF